METNDFRKLNKIKDLLSKFCDGCGKPYSEDDLRIVQANSVNVLIHMVCKACGKTHMAHIIQQLGVSNRIPIKTDLRPSEYEKFTQLSPIDNDDLLNVYEWAKEISEKKSVSSI